MHTIERLKKFAPKAKPEILVAIVKGADDIKAAKIVTPGRFHHFMAQFAAETAGLKSLSEDMNYSASRMMEVFGEKRSKTGKIIQHARNGLTLAQAKRLDAAGPEATANFLYGGEWGKKNLGNTEPGDGWRFRGGGGLHTTGRANYTALAKSTGLDLVNNPDLLRESETALLAACIEWEKRGCNAYADKDDILSISKAINLGNPRAKGTPNGMADREEWLAKAKKAFPATAPRLPMEGPLTIVRQGPMRTLSKDEATATYPDGAGIPLPGADDEDAELAAWKAKWVGVPRERVKGIQTQLRERGYSEVGDIDGLPGPRLRDALMSFQTDNGLPATGLVDNATAQAFLTGKSRKVSKERAASTTTDVDREVPGALAPARANVTTAKAGVGAAVVAGTGSLLGDAVEWLDPVKEFLVGIPVWAWAALIGAAFVGVWFNSDRGKAVLVGLRRSGRLT